MNENLSSEKESDDESLFEYEDEIIDEEDKSSHNSEEKQLNGDIFEMEN